jgi:hypothetical protein
VPLGKLGKGAVEVDALSLEVLAEEGLAADAEVAGVAGGVGVADDAVADLDIRDVLANADDLADGFVAGAEGKPGRTISSTGSEVLALTWQ